MNKTTKKYLYIACATIVCLVVIVCLIVLIKMWLEGSETHTPNQDTVDYSKYVSCSADKISESFFVLDNAFSTKHQIKVMFRNGKPSTVSYIINAMYDSHEKAEAAKSANHIKYNNYMGDYSLDAEKLVPRFSVINNEMTINLFTDSSGINTVTAPVIGLSSHNALKFQSSTIGQIMNIYNSKGLSCVMAE